jgi:hypothetical protein
MSERSLGSYMARRIPTGLEYFDAAQLCLRLYCVTGCLPEDLQAQASRQGLADAFAELARSGWVKDQESPMRAYFGAHFHAVTDRGHWIEVLASILKKGDVVDIERGEKLARLLADDDANV